MCSRSRPSKPPAGGSKAPARANIPGRPLSNTGCVGAVGTPPGMGEASPRRDDGSKFEDTAGATPFHHSLMPLPAPTWPALPGAAGDVAGADALGAPTDGVGRTGGLVGILSTAGATRALPKASDRNSPGTSNGPICCSVSGAKCSGGSPSGAGAGSAAPGMGMPGTSRGVMSSGGPMPGRDGGGCCDRGSGAVGLACGGGFGSPFCCGKIGTAG
jgi:hypothetical protein